MILIGGITRLTDAGLSMTSWKPLTGILPPINNDDWEISFNEYKKYPEYQNYNFNITIEEYKFIYFWEYIHRMLGRFIGVFFLFPLIYFYINRNFEKVFFKKFLFLFIMILLQGIMGWYMVQSGLIDKPDISHLRLSVHLIMTFIIIGYLYWIKMSIENKKKLCNTEKNLKFYNRFINIIIFFLLLQIVYGAFTSGLKAGDFWNTYPLVNGKYFPDGMFNLIPFWNNFINDDKTIQIIHRNLGVILVFLISIFCYKISRESNETIYMNIVLLSVIVFIQFMLGILTLITNSSLIVALTHQFLAVLLFLSLLKIKYYLNYVK